MLMTSIDRRVKENEPKLVHGYVAPGLEDVRTEFARNFRRKERSEREFQ